MESIDGSAIPGKVIFPGSAFHLYRDSQLSQIDRDSGVIAVDLADAKVSILEMPSHGQLLPTSGSYYFGGPGFSYLPNPGYLGEDLLTALVEYKSQRIKVTMKLVVVGAVDESEGDEAGYIDGNSGGGAELDKKANDCRFKLRIRRINLAPAGEFQGISPLTAQQESIRLATLQDAALELAQEWGLSENDMDFYFPPDLESTNPPMVIVSAADQTKTREKVMGWCLPVDNLTTFGFVSAAQQYLMQYEGKDPVDVHISRVEAKILAITRQPEHGILTLHDEEPDGYAVYRPDEGYRGKDRVEALVAVGEDIVRVVLNFVVIGSERAVDQLQGPEWIKLCPKGDSWRISDVSPPNPTLFTRQLRVASYLPFRPIWGVP